MSVYVGESHASAFGLSTAQDVAVIAGEFEGEKVELHTETKSMLEAAYEMDDCPTDARISREHLVKRDIKDKKKATERRKMLAKYVDRLDPTDGSRKYVEYERKMGRFKRQAMLRNDRDSEHGDEMTFDGEKLSEYILRNIPSNFDEVTEQHNALSYLNELEEFESKSLEEQLAVCEKMLRRLEGCVDEKSVARRDEFKSRIVAIKDEISFSKTYKKSLERALSTLEGTHGREIKDGYNLIPKAVGVVGGVKAVGNSMTASELVALYRDKVLCSDNVFEVFASLVEITEASAFDSGDNGDDDRKGDDNGRVQSKRKMETTSAVHSQRDRVGNNDD